MTDSTTAGSAGSSPDLGAWFARLGQVLPPAMLDEIGPAERAVLLDLARIAAHRSHRTAAPITTYLIGLALAELPRSERLLRLQALALHLDAP